ncbi:MAG TPA: hypothetical protein VLV48_02250 [Thermoanaerobaculia bacterium]|nr:hypothetical protein [Thermoanaerobaculia bacterium]
MYRRPSQSSSIAIQATYGGYPCRLHKLGKEAAGIAQALQLPAGHRAHLSFHAAGEWFHVAADVDRCAFDRELSMEAGHPVYRTELSLRNVATEVGLHLAQLLHVLALDGANEPVLTEAMQFEIVGF